MPTSGTNTLDNINFPGLNSPLSYQGVQKPNLRNQMWDLEDIGEGDDSYSENKTPPTTSEGNLEFSNLASKPVNKIKERNHYSSGTTIFRTDNVSSSGAYLFENYNSPKPQAPSTSLEILSSKSDQKDSEEKLSKVFGEKITIVGEKGAEATLKTLEEGSKVAKDVGDAWKDLWNMIFGPIKKVSKHPSKENDEQKQKNIEQQRLKKFEISLEDEIHKARAEREAKGREASLESLSISQQEVGALHGNKNFDAKHIDNAYGWSSIRQKQLEQIKKQKQIQQSAIQASLEMSQGPEFDKRKAGEQSVQSVYQTAG